MEIKINIEKKHLYILVVICLITIGVVVIAQTSAPVFYHTLAEIYDTDTGSSIDADENGIVDSLAISGSLGIGTTSPSEKLDVAGNIKASGTICDSVGCIGVVSGPVWTESGGDVYRDSGNVGIGTASPIDTLDVNGDIRVRGADIKDAGGTARITLTDNGRLDLKEDDGITALSIATDGNVGIGTTSPSYDLDIVNNLPGNPVILRLRDSSTSRDAAIKLSTMSGNWWIYPRTGFGDDLYFNSDANRAPAGIVLTLKQGGNVGIGTTSPLAKLEVKGGSIKATGGLIIETRTSDLPTTEATGRMWLRTDI